MAGRTTRWGYWTARLRGFRDPLSRFAVAMDALRAFAKDHPDQQAASQALRRVTDAAMAEARNLARKEASGDRSSHHGK
jgi:hypothetical protein